MKTPKCEYEIIDEDIPRLLEDIYQNINSLYIFSFIIIKFKVLF